MTSIVMFMTRKSIGVKAINHGIAHMTGRLHLVAGVNPEQHVFGSPSVDPAGSRFDFNVSTNDQLIKKLIFRVDCHQQQTVLEYSYFPTSKHATTGAQDRSIQAHPSRETCPIV